MRFLLVEMHAVDELISGRYFQSVEFEQGKSLALLLAGSVKTAIISPSIKILSTTEGLYFLSTQGGSGNVIVFDLEAAPLFGHNPEEDLLVFQRVLRFGTKTWQNLRLSVSEKLVPNSSKAIVFPFPISSKSYYRIAIDRNPDAKRREKRATGQALLVYWFGFDDKDVAKDDVSVTVFRKAMAGLPEAYATIQADAQVGPSGEASSRITSLGVTRLDGHPASKLPGELGFDEWQFYLTEAQRRFVNTPLHAPHRIEGPAGTGKTLSLVLKAIQTLRQAAAARTEHRALFIAHSEATRKAIQELFDSNDSSGFSGADRITSLQSIKITTLQSLCAEILRTEISESEFLDRDAFESKEAQLLYTLEAFEDALSNDFATHKPFLSKEFADYVETQDKWLVAEMMRHEISVVIKGRADEDLEKYKKTSILRYGLPIKSEADKGFMFLIFRGYQQRLEAAGQFDTDDVVLTASSQLSTPIWRRRRESEGYDSIFIDETHLFNLNELSVFHRLTRSDSSFPIAYSVDRSQALGDRGWSEGSFDSLMAPSEEARERASTTLIRSIFRSSPEIVNLAFSVTSAGATLFTNYQNPLDLAASAFTEQEERKAVPPAYFEYGNDEALIAGAFDRAQAMAARLEGHRSGVAIVAFSESLFAELQKFARETNKPVETLKRRGDIEVLRSAQRSNRFVLSSPDYIGGLEFDGVVLVGVDKGRVPPASTRESPDSSNFLSYASHSRLYVAITRARFQVEILGSKIRGPSTLLQSALSGGVLQRSIEAVH